MDLSNLNVVEKANTGEVLKLLHPVTGEILNDAGEKCADKKDVKCFFVKVLGADSDLYRNVVKRRLERLQNKKSKKIDMDESEAKGIDLLAKCTLDCYLIEDGKPIEFSKNEMVRLYTKYPWLREQVDKFIDERENFLAS
tara:strand:+ start:24062 stop:24481 length:420 start_codon:yes stop_codon:yes gene_type:complete